MNKFSFLLFFLFLSCIVYSQNGSNDMTKDVIQTSIGFGNMIAITISWSRNKSILYAIFHGILGWIYVIYFAIIDLRK